MSSSGKHQTENAIHIYKHNCAHIVALSSWTYIYDAATTYKLHMITTVNHVSARVQVACRCHIQLQFAPTLLAPGLLIVCNLVVYFLALCFYGMHILQLAQCDGGGCGVIHMHNIIYVHIMLCADILCIVEKRIIQLILQNWTSEEHAYLYLIHTYIVAATTLSNKKPQTINFSRE